MTGAVRPGLLAATRGSIGRLRLKAEQVKINLCNERQPQEFFLEQPDRRASTRSTTRSPRPSSSAMLAPLHRADHGRGRRRAGQRPRPARAHARRHRRVHPRRRLEPDPAGRRGCSRSATRSRSSRTSTPTRSSRWAPRGWPLNFEPSLGAGDHGRRRARSSTRSQPPSRGAGRHEHQGRRQPHARHRPHGRHL